MFEKEEAQLNNLKQHYDEVQIPDNIDAFIQVGIQKAKVKRKRSVSFRWGSLVACILLFTMLTMIRVSPTFAGYISSIPGFEKIVELVRFDKGLISAIENDFMQPIGVSDEQDGVKVTVDSVIVDEKGEQWGAVMNGVTATHPSENERIVFLESNYFKNPKELFLEFSSVRAVDKDELDVVVDVENQKILKAPSDGRLISVVKEGEELRFMVENEHLPDREHGYFLFNGDFIDANGVEFSTGSSLSSPPDKSKN